MSTSHSRMRVASLVAAIVMLLPVSSVLAQGPGDQNRPVELTFTKWVSAYPFMEGYWGGNPDNKYVGEILQRQVSTNRALTSIVRLEAIYEIHAGDHSFTALIRGGTNNVTGAAQLDGVVLAGWRTGAAVHVEFDTIPGVPGIPGCVGPVAGTTCFVGTIQVGRAPKD